MANLANILMEQIIEEKSGFNKRMDKDGSAVGTDKLTTRDSKSLKNLVTNAPADIAAKKIAKEDNIPLNQARYVVDKSKKYFKGKLNGELKKRGEAIECGGACHESAEFKSFFDQF